MCLLVHVLGGGHWRRLRAIGEAGGVDDGGEGGGGGHGRARALGQGGLHHAIGTNVPEGRAA